MKNPLSRLTKKLRNSKKAKIRSLDQKILSTHYVDRYLGQIREKPTKMNAYLTPYKRPSKASEILLNIARTLTMGLATYSLKDIKKTGSLVPATLAFGGIKAISLIDEGITAKRKARKDKIKLTRKIFNASWREALEKTGGLPPPGTRLDELMKRGGLKKAFVTSLNRNIVAEHWKVRKQTYALVERQKKVKRSTLKERVLVKLRRSN